jgi:two-component system chemotaxis response regulator CheB
MSADAMPSAAIDLVVIGASAGGVVALQTLAKALPATFAPPVLVVLHIPRDRPSSVPTLLAAQCALPVREAEDKQAIEPGTITFAPSDYHLLVEDRHHVALSIDPPVLYSRPAIDVLFDSAAETFGAGVLAILLTGASADGSEGVAAIRGAGGKAWIQDPADAVASVMPASAIARAGADAILSLDDLCVQLAALSP